MKINELIQKRRTFAIISHPDAGKTTLTEQLLLHGGIVHKAGTVKSRKNNHYAKSDWMEIEKKRGISVTSSVLQFDYNGFHINILDTPGHEDFSEDTYRTLMAVDSVVMIIDAAKGIESQTRKLFKVAKKRGIPIFTFINKIDREGKEPLDLISNLENLLGIEAYPMNWPIGMGKNFLGIYDRNTKKIHLYHSINDVNEMYLNNNYLKFLSTDPYYNQFLDDLDLLSEAGNKFNLDKIKSGSQTPVYFGSALNNFGVSLFLDSFINYAPFPREHLTEDKKIISADNNNFSGFIFKIQANMNPSHRDRIAFLRICSGEFKKGMSVTLQRTKNKFRLNDSTEFIADSREQINNAIAGDIIGLYDTGNFQIGDTIYSGKKEIKFPNLPQFTPELFVKVVAKNVMKQKSFHKGIHQLVQEGTIQFYKNIKTNDYILGAIGNLQFDVFKFRMKNEYNSDVEIIPMGYRVARWVDKNSNLDKNISNNHNLLVMDSEGNNLILFENKFTLNWFKDKYPDIKLIDRFQY